MTLQEILGLWQVDSYGRGIPRNHAALCREIEKLSPEDVGFKIVERLQTEGFITTLPNGQRTLTLKGVAERIPLPAQPDQNTESSEAHWEIPQSLRVLCRLCYTIRKTAGIFIRERPEYQMVPTGTSSRLAHGIIIFHYT